MTPLWLDSCEPSIESVRQLSKVLRTKRGFILDGGRRAEAAAVRRKAGVLQQRTTSAIKIQMARSLSPPSPSISAAKRHGVALLSSIATRGLDASPFHFEVSERFGCLLTLGDESRAGAGRPGAVRAAKRSANGACPASGPAIHPANKMDARVKPAGDARWAHRDPS